MGIDLRGHGRSPSGAGATLGDHVDDVAAVVGELDASVCILGFSFGAYVGLAYCASGGDYWGFLNVDGPVVTTAEELIAAGRPLTLDGYSALTRQQLADQPDIRRLTLDEVVSRHEAEGTPFESQVRRSLHLDAAGDLFARPTADEVAAMVAINWSVEPLALYGQVEKPSLMLLSRNAPPVPGDWGADAGAAIVRSRAAGGQRIAEQCPVTVEWFETGHFIPIEAPEAFARTVLSYVASVAPSDA